MITIGKSPLWTVQVSDVGSPESIDSSLKSNACICGGTRNKTTLRVKTVEVELHDVPYE